MIRSIFSKQSNNSFGPKLTDDNLIDEYTEDLPPNVNNESLFLEF